MKTKRIIVMLAAAAIVTLSFSFVSVSSLRTEEDMQNEKIQNSAPIGGFVLEDTL
jgi:hypothetical protein